MKGLFVIALCVAILCAPAIGARLPEVGDYLNIFVPFPSGDGTQICYTGFVIGVSDGLICMDCKCTGVFGGDKIRPNENWMPMDVCIGTGQIALLNWKEPPEGYKEVPQA